MAYAKTDKLAVVTTFTGFIQGLRMTGPVVQPLLVEAQSVYEMVLSGIPFNQVNLMDGRQVKLTPDNVYDDTKFEVAAGGAVSDMTDKVINEVKTEVKEFVEEVKTEAGKVMDIAEDLAKDIKDDVTEAGKEIASDVKDAVDALKAEGNAEVDKATKEVTEESTKVEDAVKDVANKVDEAIDTVTNVADKVAGNNGNKNKNKR